MPSKIDTNLPELPLKSPLVVPAKSQRLSEALSRLESLQNTSSSFEAPSSSAADVLDQMSDNQLMLEMGFLTEDETKTFREDVGTGFQNHPGISGRLQSLIRDVDEGRIVPDGNEKANMFLGALSYVVGGIKSKIGGVFKALEWYDKNVSDPFAGGAMQLVAALTPGEQEIEKLVSEKVDAGMNVWEALGEGFEESGLPGWVKAGIQFGADPLVFAPALKLAMTGRFTYLGVARLLDPGVELGYKAGRGIARKLKGPGKDIREPWEMLQEEFVEEYETLTAKVNASLQKTPSERKVDPLVTKEEISAFEQQYGQDRVQALKNRGFTPEEIIDIQRLEKIRGDSFLDFGEINRGQLIPRTTSDMLHKQIVRKAVISDKLVPDEVVDILESLKLVTAADVAAEVSILYPTSP